MSDKDLRNKIIEYMKEKEWSSMDSAAHSMNCLGYSDDEIYPILKDLIDECIIAQSGEIRYVGE